MSPKVERSFVQHLDLGNALVEQCFPGGVREEEGHQDDQGGAAERTQYRNKADALVHRFDHFHKVERLKEMFSVNVKAA